jgi:hypothetical protein
MKFAGSLTCSLFLVASLAAQETPLPRAGAFFVNFPTAGVQVAPDVAADGADNFQVVWQAAAADLDGQDVRIRKLTYEGAFPGEQPLAQSTALNQLQPRIAMEADGDWVAIWTSGQALDRLPIGRATKKGGASLGDEFQFTTGDATNVDTPDVALVGDDHLVGSWRVSGVRALAANFRSRGGDDFGVTAIEDFAFDGIVALAGLGGDQWVAAWHDPDVGSNGAYLRCQVAESAAEHAFLAHDDTAGEQNYPDVASLGLGRFVAVWSSDDAVVGRIFQLREDGSCTPTAPEFEVSTPGQSVVSPRVAAAADGAFVVVWKARTFDADGGIAAREFTHDGTPVGAPFPAHPAFAGIQSAPAVAVSASTFAVVWGHANDALPIERDIAARLFYRRLVFSDDFELAGLGRWSDTAP